MRDGTGAKRYIAPNLSSCKGKGHVSAQQRTPFGVISTSRECPKCAGKGKIIKEPCDKCKGIGMVRKTVKIDVNIPAGIDDGQVISIRSEGNHGINGGPNGDLRVSINVRPHPFFERDGYDVWCDITVTFAQATLGSGCLFQLLRAELSMICQREHNQEQFLGCVRGIPHINGRSKGDQFVKIIVDVQRTLQKSKKRF